MNFEATSCLTPFPFSFVYLQNSSTSVFPETLTILVQVSFSRVFLYTCCVLPHALFSFWFSSAAAISFQTLFGEPREKKLDANSAIRLRPTIVNAQNKQAGKMRKKKCFLLILHCNLLGQPY